jgi:CubicO group peptidase (beta-lactamase class C family)
MSDLERAVERVAVSTGFSGAVRVDLDGEVVVRRAYGLADRAWERPNTTETRFAIASGTKAFTALTVLRLVEDASLTLATPARELLGDDLPLIDDAVTVEHLLCHRSGIGDYLDEEDDDLDLTDYLLPVPVHTLATTEDYVTILDGFPMKAPVGERFAYNNSGFVVLALLAERATGTPYHDLVHEHVCVPAGLHDTAFLRSDELPGDTARGYLDAEGPRSNILHLPVRGVGDGGLYTSLDDVHTFWAALAAGRLLPDERVVEVVRRRDGGPPDREGYGLGFWIPAAPGTVALEGMDTGVSFRSIHRPEDGTTMTVIGNTTDGAWPFVRDLEPAVFG